MVWKDVTFGFTIAGVIAAFVPAAFFQTLFVGSGAGADPAWWQLVLHTLIGPVAAFFTLIGSMGNIPLAAVLFGSGVSFAGVMAFIFSDLVVFPVLRIASQYFGWRMAAYILVVFLASLVATALILHAGFDAFGLLPDASAARASRLVPAERFGVDYTLALNTVFGALAAGLYALKSPAAPGEASSAEHDDSGTHGGDGAQDEHGDHEDDGNTQRNGRRHQSRMQQTLTMLAIASLVWLAGGAAVALIV